MDDVLALYRLSFLFYEQLKVHFSFHTCTTKHKSVGKVTCFSHPLPPHPPSVKVAVNTTTKLTLYFVWTSSTLDLGERGAIKSVARDLN